MNHSTISSGLAQYIMDKSHAEILIKPVKDALSIEVICDRNLNAFVGLVEQYYSEREFGKNEPGCSDPNNFPHYRLLSYIHKSGSNSQIQITENSKYIYHIFINDSENPAQENLRHKLTLLSKLERQKPFKN